MPQTQPPISPEMVLRAYLAGAFPMADPQTGRIDWFQPDPRAVQPFAPGDPLGGFRVRRSLAKTARNAGFEITRDQAFDQVIAACAVPREDDPQTWINAKLMSLYTQLHELGWAHSVEAWRDGQLVGGLYGLALGGAFFGESMFSREPYASQVCYVHLVEHLLEQKFRLLDVQFVNPHIAQFGVVEVPHEDYMKLLEDAVVMRVVW